MVMIKQNGEENSLLIIGGYPLFWLNVFLILRLCFDIFAFFQHPESYLLEVTIILIVGIIVSSFNLMIVAIRLGLRPKFGVYGFVYANQDKKQPIKLDKMAAVFRFMTFLIIVFTIFDLMPAKFGVQVPSLLNPILCIFVTCVMLYSLKNEVNILSRLTTEQRTNLKKAVGVKCSEIAPKNRI